MTDRPISVVDFLATVCQILDIDYAQEVVATGGRPIRIVDIDERLIQELLG